MYTCDLASQKYQPSNWLLMIWFVLKMTKRWCRWCFQTRNIKSLLAILDQNTP